MTNGSNEEESIPMSIKTILKEKNDCQEVKENAIVTHSNKRHMLKVS